MLALGKTLSLCSYICNIGKIILTQCYGVVVKVSDVTCVVFEIRVFRIKVVAVIFDISSAGSSGLCCIYFSGLVLP